jgi:hypothetical protein
MQPPGKLSHRRETLDRVPESSRNESRRNVSGRIRGKSCRISVVGRLDAQAAEQVTAACEEALPEGAGRLELDLTEVTAATPEGIAVISHCFGLSDQFTDGVRVTVSTTVGRRALLDSMSTI